VAGGNNASFNGATVLFSGVQVPNLDEVFFVNYGYNHSTSPQSNSLLTGLQAFVADSSNLTAGIQRSFLTGTTLQMSYVQRGQESNNLRAEFNPTTNANFGLSVTQPLLRGFGVAVNNRNIRIARNQVKIADLVFKEQVIATVSAVVNLYVDLVSFRQDVKVRTQALALAEKLYNDNRKQVEIGTLAPIEIVRAEAEVARAAQELTQAETQVLQQETVLKNYLSRVGLASPAVAEARVIPTTNLEIPATERVQPVQDLIAMAVENRPELAQTDVQIENARISLVGSKAAMLPELNLVASAQNNGLAGTINPLREFNDPITGLPFVPSGGPFVGNISTVWGQLLRRNYPDYSIGFQLNIPIRNRQATADVVRDQLQLRQSELRQRQQLNQVRVDVQNALIGLQQSRARYQASEKSRILQEQTLDAEQKKYALGASTIFFVIQAQRDLAQAQAAEVAALSQYNRARVQLLRATGQILDTFDVSIEEAMKGKVDRAADPIPVITN
jgi:outer membrane protein TolC